MKLPKKLNASQPSWLYCLNIFLNIRAKSQIQEAMKQHIVDYGEKPNQRSDEAFNVGKEIEAMKSRFVVFVGQLCVRHTF